jgi:hypothetical protein
VDRAWRVRSDRTHGNDEHDSRARIARRHNNNSASLHDFRLDVSAEIANPDFTRARADLARHMLCSGGVWSRDRLLRCAQASPGYRVAAPYGGFAIHRRAQAPARAARPPASPAPSEARKALQRVLPSRDGERRKPRSSGSRCKWAECGYVSRSSGPERSPRRAPQRVMRNDGPHREL